MVWAIKWWKEDKNKREKWGRNIKYLRKCHTIMIWGMLYLNHGIEALMIVLLNNFYINIKINLYVVLKI